MPNSPVTKRHENLIKKFLLIFFSSHIRVSRSSIERGFNALAQQHSLNENNKNISF